jgi:hypothetical protein
VSGSAGRGPFASWEPVSGQWLDADGMSSDLFAQSEPFSGRWPASGSMRNGQCYRQPTPGLVISASGSSSSPGLLPTPSVADGTGGHLTRSGDRGGELLLPGGAKALASGQRLLPTPVVTNRAGMEPSPATVRGTRGSDLGPVIGGLLPTPTTATGRNSRHGDTSRGDDLPEAVKYLPTPNASDGKGASQPEGRERSGRSRKPGDADLPEVVSLLKTPTAQLAINGGSQHPDKRKAGGHGPTLADQVEHLLPTPNASDWKGSGGTQGRNRDGRPRPPGDVDLPEAVTLLPTPRATDGTKGGPNQRGSSGDLMLPSAVMELLPTPAARDWKSGQSNLIGTNARPLSEVVEMTLLPTPSATDSHGHYNRSGERSAELLLPGVVKALLPTPAAHDSGNTPENHLRKKPGRVQVTSLQVIADHGLFPTGGRLPAGDPTSQPSGDGSA